MSGATTRRLLLATGNLHKLDEVRAILGPPWEVDAADPDVEETGETFEANALLKAQAVLARTGETVVAEDSGIEIDALDGRPGVHSARWTSEPDWIPRVLRELAAAPERPRTARYVAAVVLVGPDEHEIVVRGTVEGHIAPEPRGSGGFGYDPIFVPDEGDGRTFAQMDPAEKHALSHRGRAVRALLTLLD